MQRGQQRASLWVVGATLFGVLGLDTRVQAQSDRWLYEEMADRPYEKQVLDWHWNALRGDRPFRALDPDEALQATPFSATVLYETLPQSIAESFVHAYARPLAERFVHAPREPEFAAQLRSLVVLVKLYADPELGPLELQYLGVARAFWRAVAKGIGETRLPLSARDRGLGVDLAHYLAQEAAPAVALDPQHLLKYWTDLERHRDCAAKLVGGAAH